MQRDTPLEACSNTGHKHLPAPRETGAELVGEDTRQRAPAREERQGRETSKAHGLLAVKKEETCVANRGASDANCYLSVFVLQASSRHPHLCMPGIGVARSARFEHLFASFLVRLAPGSPRQSVCSAGYPGESYHREQTSSTPRIPAGPGRLILCSY